jgi:alcohol dehydrogenase class IV
MTTELATSFRYRGSPVRLYAGDQAFPSLAYEVKSLKGARILVLTSGSSIKSGLIDRLKSEAGLEFALFDGVAKESPLDAVEAAYAQAKEMGADLLIGVGGGSAMVTTRAVAILQRKDGGAGRNLLIPTTPTTAMSRAGAAVLDTAAHKRVEHYDAAARALAVILDGEALKSAPVTLFRNAAVAAFCGTVEQLTGPTMHPLAYADASTAVTLLSEGLMALADRPDDAAVRIQIASGAFLAGRCADSMTGVSAGVMLAMGHQLQVLHRVEQGMAMSSLLGASLTWDLGGSTNTEARVVNALSASGESTAAAAARAVLNRAGMPTRLSELGIKREDLRQIAETSMDSFFAQKAPRPPATADDLLGVLEDAF